MSFQESQISGRSKNTGSVLHWPIYGTLFLSLFIFNLNSLPRGRMRREERSLALLLLFQLGSIGALGPFFLNLNQARRDADLVEPSQAHGKPPAGEKAEAAQDDASNAMQRSDEEELMEAMGLPTAFTGRLRPERVGVWWQRIDPGTGRKYYKNDGTGEVRWNPPLEDYIPLDAEGNAKDPSSGARAAFNCPEGARKYWYQRFRIFSRLEEGVAMDEESWFDVTPERIAQHHAGRLAGMLALDPFCGVGGSAVQLARTCHHVCAADLDPSRVGKAARNAGVYGVKSSMNFLVADALSLLLRYRCKFSCILLSPPWGGPEYLRQASVNPDHLRPAGLSTLLALCLHAADSVAAFLPRNIDVDGVRRSVPSQTPCEVSAGFAPLLGKGT